MSGAFPLLKDIPFGNFSKSMLSRKILITITFCLLCLSSELSLAQWQVVKYRNREYVTLKSFCDFYGFRYEPLAAKNTTVLIGQRGQIKLSLESRDAEINGVKYNLSFPISSNGNDFIISKTDVNSLFEPVLRPYKVRRKEKATTVIIDAGHGGSDSGAISRVGSEKQFTLDTAFRLKRILERLGYRTYLTRTTDTFIPLDRRALSGNGRSNTIFVSIHFNKGQSRASGIETFALAPRGAPSTGIDNVRVADFQGQSGNKTDEQNILLATAIHRSAIKNTNTPDRGVKRARFWVLRYNNIPAILFEGGFLSNSQEARNIARESYRQSLAQSIADGIIAYNRLMEGGGSNSPEIKPIFKREDDEEPSPKKPVIEISEQETVEEKIEKPKKAQQTSNSQSKQLGRGLTSKQPAKVEQVPVSESSQQVASPVKPSESKKETISPPSKKEKEETKITGNQSDVVETPKKPKEKTAKPADTPVSKKNSPTKVEESTPESGKPTPAPQKQDDSTPSSKDEVVVIEQKDIVIVSQPDETTGQNNQNIPTEISVSKLLEMATNAPPEKANDKSSGN